jgi:amino acid adenylation domain-containing protein
MTPRCSPPRLAEKLLRKGKKMGVRSAEAVAPTAREFWKGILAAGAAAPIARWVSAPATASSATCRRLLPSTVVSSLSETAGDLQVSMSALLIAAHAKVLRALTGEREVVTGLVPGASRMRRPLPCRLDAEDGSWRELAAHAGQSQADVLAHNEFPIEDLRRELALTHPPFETVLDLSMVSPASVTDTSDVVLRVSFVQDNDLLWIVLDHRTDVVDGQYAQRIAGYYVTALQHMLSEPDSPHQTRTLLSDGERKFQFEDLAGPDRPVPDRRFHELFEDHVRAQPDTVAAVCRGISWTYDELNRRANRIAHGLLARGLRAEDRVAVVTERGLDWLAAVIGIFKAGCAYLPIEPQFPAGRIESALSQSECRLVLSEPRSEANVRAAVESLPGTVIEHIDAVCRDARAETDPGVQVGRDQLAYIYFTSGSTGKPKGAMCEHAGMLNHLYAKIDDFGIGAGQVVAQTAPQCFDISLWQLVSALLVGGRTLIVEQDAVLDVQRYLDLIVGSDVEVLQVVPSYLEVVLSHLEEKPRPLGRLRCVSATGEALKKELAARWFATYPDIKLANAYGLTETSDDTNHEVMAEVPVHDSVPLGRAVNNVRVYVVDETLDPVPLGAPGEIVFSGVCVGRGYINDEERTRAAFLTDPHRPGERLYRSGDFGRWLPEGKLEFLGRRDAQVKIRGFRIEIGEIENQLLRVPGIRDAAVVVTTSADNGERSLAGFYSSDEMITADEPRALLAARLPEYMVPGALHWLETLPLTGNGKIDKKALTRLAGELGRRQTTDRPAPRPGAEQRLATAWAEVLKVPVDHVGRDDHFFDEGGTSLTAIRLSMRLGRQVSLADVTSHPVLHDLAELVEAAAASAESAGTESAGHGPAGGPLTGAIPEGRAAGDE